MPSILSLLDTPEPPHLTMKSRAGTKSVEELNALMEPLLANAQLERPYRDLSRATVFLWHDHFEPSHELAQDVEGPDGSLLHGILHRREPDFSNARYWFRRVGPNHPSFDPLAGKVKSIVGSAPGDSIARQILPGGKWNPLGFVDFMEDAARRKDAASEKLLREIQAAEIRSYLESLPSRVASILPKSALGPPSV
jgi:hypothetical protein